MVAYFSQVRRIRFVQAQQKKFMVFSLGVCSCSQSRLLLLSCLLFYPERKQGPFSLAWDKDYRTYKLSPLRMWKFLSREPERCKIFSTRQTMTQMTRRARSPYTHMSPYQYLLHTPLSSTSQYWAAGAGWFIPASGPGRASDAVEKYRISPNP